MFGSWFRRAPKIETRAAGSGYTAEMMGARESYISGRRGLAEMTGTVQSCVSLWESGLGLAHVDGTDLLDRRSLAMLGRSLALRGEAVFLIRETGLVPIAEWDLKTRDGTPTAYRLTIAEAGGGRSETALAGEILHIRIGVDPAAPWRGVAPLRRASLTAGLLHAVEAALVEIYETAPIGSLVVPFPEAPETDLEAIARGFRGMRGRVLVRESVNVSSAGGPSPLQDWLPHDLTPDLARAMTAESLAAARDAVCAVFGVLPALMNAATTGPMVREAQRHLATWVLQPVAELVAEETSRKLGTAVAIDVLTPLAAFDAGGHARAASTIISALAEAKGAGLSPAEVSAAFGALDWSEIGAK